jgi:hypothetical protein
VKNIFFLIILSLSLGNCFGQDTVLRKNRLSDSVLERYYVLKSDPAIKQGPYKALFRRHTVVASGNYTKNLKTGTWQFFDSAGKLVEKYDYDKSAFTYEAPAYTGGDDITYAFDDTLKAGDKLSRPIKIGGIYYGYIPYVTMFQLPFNMFGVNPDDFEADVELLISPMGRLADYNVHVTSATYEYDHLFRMDVNLFSPEDRTFVPATFNGKPVLVRILIKCFVTSEGGLDFY